MPDTVEQLVIRVHVHPIDDLIDHDTESDDCVCGPDFDFVSGGVVIVHHSLDGRELVEQTGSE